MRFRDLLALGMSALWRQKLRSALTLLGVVIGSATLTASLSIGKGLSKAIDDQFRKEEALRQIEVFPSFDGSDEERAEVPPEILDVRGALDAARRDRIREAAVKRWKRTSPGRAPKPLSRERLEELAALPHVVSAMPVVEGVGRVFFEEHSSDADISGVGYRHRRLADRLVEGRTFSSDSASEVIAHEYLLYRLGVRDDAAFAAAVGKPLRVALAEGRRTPVSLLTLFNADASSLSPDEVRVLDRAWKSLPSALGALDLTPADKAVLDKVLRRKKPGTKPEDQKQVVETFTLVGVIRSPAKNDKHRENDFLEGPMRDSEVLLPLGTADALFGQMPSRRREGYSRARVIVDREENIKEVVDRIKKMGLHEFSMGVVIEQVKMNVALITFGMNFIALIALIVASVGITNTLFTSVLERTREIGLMKAVGAKDRQILAVFLVEGTLLGLVGGLAGVVCGWLLSLPGDATARSLMAEQTGEPPPETMFLFPAWLLIGVPLFALVVTTLAAALPARRAARIHPVEALRYE